MAIPNEPYTRKEQYLNAIATGNASGVPDTPYTREEMYLDAIAKGGGGGGGVLVVHDVDGTLDKTWQEIHDAFLTSGVVVYNDFGSTAAIVEVAHDNKSGDYIVTPAKGFWLPEPYYANSADDYPSN